MRFRSSRAAIAIFVAALLLAPAPASVAAQPRPASGARFDIDAALGSLWRPGGLTAEQAARRARTVSPAARAARADRAAAGARLDAAAILRVPRLTLFASYTRLSDLDPPATSQGEGDPVRIPVLLDSYALGAALEVPLSDHLLRYPHLVAGARHGAAAAAETEVAAARAADLAAREAYYEWVRARLSVLVAERLVAQVDANLAQVRARTEAETASRADLLRLEAQRAEAAQTLLALSTGAGQREHALRIAIGAGDGETLAVGEDMRADPGRADNAPRPVPAQVAEALRRRPEVRALDRAITASERAPRAAAADRWPRLDGFAQVDYADPNSRVFPPEDEFELTWAAGVRMSYSIDGALAAGPAIAEARAGTARLRAERDALADAIQLEVRTSIDSLELARRSLTTAGEGLAAAEENYRVRRELFAADRATSVELVDAETELLRARTAAVDARIDLRLAAARLRHASGLDP